MAFLTVDHHFVISRLEQTRVHAVPSSRVPQFLNVCDVQIDHERLKQPPTRQRHHGPNGELIGKIVRRIFNDHPNQDNVVDTRQTGKHRVDTRQR